MRKERILIWIYEVCQIIKEYIGRSCSFGCAYKKMNKTYVNRILKDTDYVRCGGTEEEKKAAQYLIDRCADFGVEAHMESFEIQMAYIKVDKLYADGKEIPCKAYKNCGSVDLTADFVYAPDLTDVTLNSVKDKIVLLDGGIPYNTYQDLYEHGAKGFICWVGNVNYRDNDIDQRELRPHVSMGKIIPGACINAKDAFSLVKDKTKEIHMVIEQDEYMGASQNVVAEIPGTTDEWIVFTAHYDSTSLSHGAYDNMTGCIGLLGIMEAMKMENNIVLEILIMMVLCYVVMGLHL